MSSPADVAELLKRLGKVRSPMERMRLLSRAWRQIRALSADERAVLADAVGLPGAERFLARIAGRKIPVGDLVRSLADASDDDPGALRAILRSMGDEDGRRSLLRRGRDALAESLAPVGEPEAEPGSKPEPEPDPEPDPEPERAPLERGLVPESLRAPAPEPDPRPTAPPAAFEPPEPPPEPTPDETPPPPPEPVRAPPAAPALDGPPRFPSDADRLREFESIGPSWARRRDVMRRIAAGEFRSLADLEPFLARIEAIADRRWCTLALVEHGGLSRGDLERLIRDSADDVVRRRAARHADEMAG